MFRFGPPEPSPVNVWLPLVRPDGENTIFGKSKTGNGYTAIPFLFAKSSPSEIPATSKLPLCREYPARASFTTLGENTCVSLRIV